MTKEAMEYLAELKLHQVELNAEKERLLHQEKRLDEEIQILEEALKKKRQSKERKKKPPPHPKPGPFTGRPEWMEKLSEEESLILFQKMRERFGNEWRMENRSF
jgi:small-conductance mechanosensitive channel